MKYKLLKSLKYLFPLFSVTIPIIGIIGSFISPPSWAESTLRNYNYNSTILVGYSSRPTFSSVNSTHHEVRSYVLFPNLKTVTISMYSDSNGSMKVTSKESKYFIYKTFILYILFLFGTWWYWLGPAAKQS